MITATPDAFANEPLVIAGRNVTALNAALIKLGMAAQSRDVTKRDRAGCDEYGAALAALLEAHAR